MRAREPVCPLQDPSENSLADSFYSSGVAAAIFAQKTRSAPRDHGRGTGVSPVMPEARAQILLDF